MAATVDDIEWAETEIERLGILNKKGDAFQLGHGGGQFVEALEFLRLSAGSQSEFYRRASTAVANKVPSLSCDMVRFALNGWIKFVQRGLVDLPPEAQFRQAAATDLMDPVERRLQDKEIVPAAPVMLAGAALEELLRAMIDTAGLRPRAKPSINAYATALRIAEIITGDEGHHGLGGATRRRRSWSLRAHRVGERSPHAAGH